MSTTPSPKRCHPSYPGGELESVYHPVTEAVTPLQEGSLRNVYHRGHRGGATLLSRRGVFWILACETGDDNDSYTWSETECVVASKKKTVERVKHTKQVTRVSHAQF